MIDRDRLARLVMDDRELAFRLGRLDALVRIGPEGEATDIRVAAGRVVAVAPAAPGGTPPDLAITAPDAFWQAALVASPGYAAASLTAGGARFDGDLGRIVAPHYVAWERLLMLMRAAAADAPPPRPAPPDRRDTDDAVGRYAYVAGHRHEARLFYEEAGEGGTVLLLHATAGADARQWRHLLAYPPLRRRFRMIAYDLPGHGRSLPPLGTRWWEEAYRPSRDDMIGWATGLVDALGLDRPLFMGCSVGGQLALDLAAWAPARFGGFVSINGWCRPSPAMAAFDNAPFRDPAVSIELQAGRTLGTTAPGAPESCRQETAWLYRANAQGLYAGDNDYFMRAHDLTVDGWRIDTRRTPLFVLAGEHDRTALSPEDGAPAIPRHVPGAVFRLLPGLGHFAPSDDPEAFCEAIVPILDALVAACAASREDVR